MTDARTKTELLDTMRVGRERWDTVLTEVGGRLSDPGVEGGWSVKEIVAHVAAWEEAAVLRLEAAARGETPAHPIYDNHAQSIDERNAQIDAQFRDLAAPEVLNRDRQLYARLVSAVQALPEDALTDPHRFAWSNGEPLLAFVAGDSYEHYQEHGDAIRAWLNKPRQRA